MRGIRGSHCKSRKGTPPGHVKGERRDEEGGKDGSEDKASEDGSEGQINESSSLAAPAHVELPRHQQ